VPFEPGRLVFREGSLDDLTDGVCVRVRREVAQPLPVDDPASGRDIYAEVAPDLAEAGLLRVSHQILLGEVHHRVGRV